LGFRVDAVFFAGVVVVTYVCQQEGIPWRSFKYIFDHADRDSETSWQAHVRAGQDLFLQRLGELAKAFS
jgi:hypothetical protein